MRARLPHIARFAVYAVVVAIGIHHLVTRDDARGSSGEPAGEWVRGVTTQRLPVSVKVDDHRVVAVDVTYRVRCADGVQTVLTDGFVDRFDGDFERDGQRFADDWRQSHAGEGGQAERVTARINGVAEGGTARGSVTFEIDVENRGRVVRACESGPVGFALDLP